MGHGVQKDKSTFTDNTLFAKYCCHTCKLYLSAYYMSWRIFCHLNTPG